MVGDGPVTARQRLAPSAANGHKSASASHRSPNRPPWPPASKSRRTRSASHDEHVSNKEDGHDEVLHHLDFQTGGDRALAHSLVSTPPPTTSPPQRLGDDRSIGPSLS